MLTIVTPNPDRSLLTEAELRAAIGDDAGSVPADKITALGLRVSATITKACRVAEDGIVPPTLRLETATDTFRPKSHNESLILSRKPIVSVTSVTENDIVLAATDYEIQAGAGMLQRLSGDRYTCWPCGKIVVVYPAGWAIVPDDLKAIAQQLASLYWLSDGVDPMEKGVTIPDVYEAERWVDLASDAILPDDLMAALDRGGYLNFWVG